jgi:pimeloyl-ACP methyl ester carboxylesterase
MTIINSTETTTKKFLWTWKQSQFSITYETFGQGKPILLLPPLSTVSTRTEMAAIGQLLAPNYQVTLLDWLGFGDSDRPFINYEPAVYHQLLTDFIKNHFNLPIIIIAAGHSAGYALEMAHQHPETITSIVLIAPTYKGPLRVMGIPTAIRTTLKNLVNMPIIGHFLYYLNTTPYFLRLMYRRHVYTDESKLTPQFITDKRKITQQTGARFAPVAFVTGTLDPKSTLEEFLQLISSLKQPILTIIAEKAPPYSKKVMETIATLPNMESKSLLGTLGLAEEYSLSVTTVIKTFIAQNQ